MSPSLTHPGGHQRPRAGFFRPRCLPMEVAQFSGPPGCSITLPKAAAGGGHVPARARPQRGPAPSQAAYHGQNQRQGIGNAEALSSVLGEPARGSTSAGNAPVPRALVRRAATPAGWARWEPAAPQPQARRVAFAPLILLCCLGNDGIQHRSDLGEWQTSRREHGGKGQRGQGTGPGLLVSRRGA